MLNRVYVLQEIEEIDDFYDYQSIRQVSDLFESRTRDLYDDFENQDKYDNFNLKTLQLNK